MQSTSRPLSQAGSFIATLSCAALLAGCHITMSATIPSTQLAASSAPVFQRTVTLSTENGEFSDIRFNSSAKNATIEVVQGGDQVVIQAVIASEDPDTLKDLENSITHNSTGGILTVGIANGNYQCTLSEMNGTLRRAIGGCVATVKITVPRQNHTRVMVNGLPVTPNAPFSYEELFDALVSRNFDNERLELLDLFVHAPNHEGRYLRVDQAIDIIRLMTFDDGKLAVARAFSGHIIDPQNAVSVESVITFDSNKVEAIRELSR
jgi:hypothetical protein